MNRRQLLTFQHAGAAEAMVEPAPPILSGLTTYSGSWTEAEVKHLLRRTMFGATKADVNYFTGKTMTQTVTELLTPAVSPPSPPLYAYPTTYDDPYTNWNETWVDKLYDSMANGFRLRSYRAWWISQMLNQPRTIQEKMTLFWHNHFSTETGTVQDARMCYNHNALLRQYALGNFKTLTKAITLDPAMLVYLNGNKNTKTAPDENYGRELQELFTVGKDANGVPYYTESDVQAAAKVLTGYRINGLNGTTITSYLDTGVNKHDTSNKTFSSFYNNTVITGRSGTAGANELDDLLDMIFARDQVALFICRKLYRYFIYYTIDSDAEANVIQPLADIFRTNNYEIAPVLQALFTSEHFYDAANRGAVIKTPVDFVVGLCRDYNVVFPDAALYKHQYYLWYQVFTMAGGMGQIVGDPPNVAGWPAYYQEPQFHELWINTNTLPSRNIFSDLMSANGFSYRDPTTTVRFTVTADVVAYTATLTNPGDPDLLIQEIIDRHYSEDALQKVKDYMKTILLSNQVSNYYWTNAWTDYINDPTNTTKYNTVATRLKAVFKYLMDLSEYQLS